jgi:hypothetical protein
MAFELFPKRNKDSDHTGLFGQRGAGLDLREELHVMIHGTDRTEGHGYWVVLRHFDRSQFSEGYNRATGDGDYYQVTGEGVGGPMYPFDDIAVRTMHKDLTTGAARYVVEQTTPMGGMPISYRTYYLAHDVLPLDDPPTEADAIYEINYIGEEEPPASVVQPPYLKTWTIQEITPYRDKGGRIEFYSVICGLNQLVSEK